MRKWLRALALVVTAHLAGNQAALAQEMAAIEAAANVQLAGDFVAIMTGGNTALPAVDAATAASIAGYLLQGDLGAATQSAQEWALGAAVEYVAGGSASAILSALSLGERLGWAAHEWLGEGRLLAEYDRLGGINGMAGWPRNYAEALEDGFLGPVFDTRVRPIAVWLRESDGGSASGLSEAYYERLAYQMLLGMRDLDLGYERYGLDGDARTPEALAAAVAVEQARAAAEAIGRREAILWMQEVMQAEADHAAAARDAQAALEALAQAEVDERESAQAALLQAEADEAAAAQRTADARAALAKTEVNQAGEGALLPPLAAPTPGLLMIMLERTETLGQDHSLLHLRIANPGTASVPAVRVSVAPLRLPPQGGGVAWGAEPAPVALGPGAAQPVSVFASGEIGAVVVTLAAMGETVATAVFPLDHVSPSPAAPVPSVGEAIDLPAVFEGTGEGVHHMEA